MQRSSTEGHALVIDQIKGPPPSFLHNILPERRRHPSSSPLAGLDGWGL